MTGGSSHSVRLLDADTGKELRTFSKDPVYAVAFHPNDKWVVGVVREGFYRKDGTVKVWDVATGREVVSFQAHKTPPTGMDLSADGKRIAVCFNHGQVSVWSLNAEP